MKINKLNPRRINSKHEFIGVGKLTKDEESEIIETFKELFDSSNPLDSYIKTINYFIKNWGINKPLAPIGEFKTIEEYQDWASESRGTSPDLVGNIENFIATEDSLIDYLDELPSVYNSRKFNSHFNKFSCWIYKDVDTGLTALIWKTDGRDQSDPSEWSKKVINGVNNVDYDKLINFINSFELDSILFHCNDYLNKLKDL